MVKQSEFLKDKPDDFDMMSLTLSEFGRACGDEEQHPRVPGVTDDLDALRDMTLAEIGERFGGVATARYALNLENEKLDAERQYLLSL